MNETNSPIYLKFYSLIKEFDGMIRDFPKHQKYTLGDRLLKTAWQCLDLVIEINNLPDHKKKEKIKKLSNCFDKLKVRIRMAQELKLISVGQFTHIQANYIKEAGSMIGGWLKWAGEKR